MYADNVLLTEKSRQMIQFEKSGPNESQIDSANEKSRIRMCPVSGVHFCPD